MFINKRKTGPLQEVQSKQEDIYNYSLGIIQPQKQFTNNSIPNITSLSNQIIYHSNAPITITQHPRLRKPTNQVVMEKNQVEEKQIEKKK